VDAPTPEELAAAEQVTLAPPSRYRSWVGEVSRSAIPANDVPRVSQLMVPHPLTMATAPPAPPARDPRGADHALADVLRTGLPRAGLVSAAMISASVLLGAALLTAGRLYELRARPATAVPVMVTPPREQALERPAPPAPPARPTVVTAAPVAALPVPPPASLPRALTVLTGPRPPRDVVRRAQSRITDAISSCLGPTGAGWRVRVAVLYDAATGRALSVRLGGALSRLPQAGCMREAVWRESLPPFGEGVWEAGYALSLRGG
jgi:hypothetical protein